MPEDRAIESVVASRTRDASSWGRIAAWLVPIAGFALLVVLDSGDAHLRAARALLDFHASNIGDPWPTIVAAGVWRHAHHADLYRDFADAGASFIYPPFAAIVFAPFGGFSHEK